MKILLFILLNLLFFAIGFSQQKEVTFSVYGQIVDEKEEALPYVSIGLFSIKDSSYVKGTATETNGRFSFQIPEGSYYAKVSYLSFKNKTINHITVINKDVDLKKTKLKPSVNNLADFEVVEEKRLMELDLDKKVFNVDKDITNRGATASEILDNVPSVSVDVEGNVSLRGSQNVRVLINGIPSGMTGMTAVDAIKQLDASLIQKVEVITNPSAKYDAEGEVGIINIILKKDKREGINGSLNLTFGYPNNLGGGFNVTYKNKNYRVFAGYDASFKDSPGSMSSKQQFFYPDTSFTYESNQNMLRYIASHNFRLGTEVSINKYNSFTISGNYSFGDGTNEVNLVYTDFNELDEVAEIINRDELEFKDRYSFGTVFNYRKTFKQKERLLTFDASYSERIDNEESTISQVSNVNLDNHSENRIYNYEGRKDWFLQMDYKHPIKKGKLELGVKSVLSKIGDDYGVEEFDNIAENWFFVPGFKNNLNYSEQVSAAYFMFGSKLENFSYQFGLRSEYTDVKTEFLTTNEKNDRDYLKFFPSTHFSYELKKNNSIQLGYSRRINRPKYFYLLPFFSYSNNRSNASGNANLNPEFIDSYELGHLKNWKKITLLSSVYYRYTTNVIDWITFSNSLGILERTPINLGDKNAFGFEFSGSYEVFKWWNLRGSYNFYREVRKGDFDGVRYDLDQYSWETKLNSRWNVNKKINLQASFNYNAPKQSPQGEIYARYSLDLGIGFDVLKGNGTLTFTGKDVFNSRKRRSIVYADNYTSENIMQWRSRFFRVNFTYRINQKKTKNNMFKNG